MPIQVYLLDSTPNTQKLGQLLANAEEKEPVNPTDFAEGLNSALLESMPDYFFVGSTQKDIFASVFFGGFSANDFAEKFNNFFKLRFINAYKEQVQHIYLIGNHIGFIDQERLEFCFAQQVVQALHAYGFKNLKVHALASERAEKSTNSDFLVEAMPDKDVLDREENIFLAGETYQLRKQRLKAAAPHDVEEREKAIEAIKKEITRLTDAKGGETPEIKEETNAGKQSETNIDKKISFLERLIASIRGEVHKSVLAIFRKYVAAYKAEMTFDGLGINPDSATYKFIKNYNTSPRTSFSGSGSVTQETQEAKLAPSSAPLGVNQKQLAAVQWAIEDLRSKLKSEMSKLEKRNNSACFSLFSYFTNYEMNTKSDKEKCLNFISEGQTLAHIQSRANAALLDTGSRKNRGYFNTTSPSLGVSRTSNLLSKIIDEPEAILADYEAYLDKNKTNNNNNINLGQGR